MQIEPYSGKSGYKLWLSEQEQEQLRNYFAEEPEKKLAIELGLHGLRTDEILDVSKRDVRRMDVEDEAYTVTVQEGKTGYRYAPLRRQTKTEIYALASARSLPQDVPIIDYSDRSLRNWCEDAGEYLAEETGEEHWKYLQPHDLRRTWATYTYYRLPGDRALQLVMSWGGWSDVQTFTEHYLASIVPDEIAIGPMREAGLL